MALRQSVYVGHFYEQLLKQGELTPDGRLPLVLAIVIYNGKADWRGPQELAELIQVFDEGAAVFAPRLRYVLIDMGRCRPAELRGSNLVALLIRLERGRTRSALRQVVRDLGAALRGPDEGGLRRAFVVWLQRVLLPGKGEEDIPELVDLEDFRAMLSERVEEWNREIARDAQREMLLQLLEDKFGQIDSRTRIRVLHARRQSLFKWAKQLVRAERLDDVFSR